jgi:hypothetical protein
MNASPLLTELIVVREWLQETAPPPQRPEATTGYWKFTKHNVMQSLRTGMGHKDGLVKQMDPDAVNREGGRGLAADDTVSFFLCWVCPIMPNSGVRTTIKVSCKHCTATSVQAESRKPSIYAEKHTSLGVQRAFVARGYFRGAQFVSSIMFLTVSVGLFFVAL